MIYSTKFNLNLNSQSSSDAINNKGNNYRSYSVLLLYSLYISVEVSGNNFSIDNNHIEGDIFFSKYISLFCFL